MINELKDTVDLMNSKDYKDRFLAEYYQLKIRSDKLKDMVLKWDDNKLNFEPTCPRSIYNLQLNYMESYLNVLKERAQLENINIE